MKIFTESRPITGLISMSLFSSIVIWAEVKKIDIVFVEKWMITLWVKYASSIFWEEIWDVARKQQGAEYEGPIAVWEDNEKWRECEEAAYQGDWWIFTYREEIPRCDDAQIE